MDIDINNLTLDEAAGYLDQLAEYCAVPLEEMNLTADLHQTAHYIQTRRANEDRAALEQDLAYQDAVFYLDAHRATNLIEE